MWPGGQVWKPGPTSPATVAALPRGEWFRMRIFIVAGGADPGSGAERLAERLVGGDTQATSFKTMAPNPLGRIRSPAQKAFGDTRLCGAPSERRFVFRVDFQGLHPSSFLDKGDELGKDYSKAGRWLSRAADVRCRRG